jgi:hypothetical protein
MKFYPYSKLKSDNLNVFLMFTRVIATLAFVLLIWLLKDIYYFFQSYGLMRELVTKDALFLTFKQCLVFFTLSGACAAIVSCEYSFTKSKNI